MDFDHIYPSHFSSCPSNSVLPFFFFLLLNIPMREREIYAAHILMSVELASELLWT